MLAADRLSVRWYLGYALDEPLPDAATLTRLRQRLGLPFFRRFFEHVVDLCVDAGLVWGQELVADATRVPANADIDSLYGDSRMSTSRRCWWQVCRTSNAGWLRPGGDGAGDRQEPSRLPASCGSVSVWPLMAVPESVVIDVPH
jgi:hypothetical protein